MTEQPWEILLAVIKGETIRPLPTGFIIDSPWLPNWAGQSILEYFTHPDRWFQANMQAITTFPDTMFLPGFWSEYGMCTEPSAFGAICSWEENEFPFAKPILRSPAEVERLERPNPKKDGLLPLFFTTCAALLASADAFLLWTKGSPVPEPSQVSENL